MKWWVYYKSKWIKKINLINKVNGEIIKWSDECTISQIGYKRNYLNNKVNGEITKGTSG